MTRAAEILHIAQPALSQQIRNLEDELGVQLFHRFSSGVRLTEAGVIFRTHTKTILRQIDEMLVMVRNERDMPTGEVVLGLPSSTAKMIAIPLLSALIENLPGIKLKFLEAPSADLVKLLTRGDADFIIAVDPSPTSALIALPLGTEQLYLVQLPKDVRRTSLERISVSEVAKVPLFLMPSPNSIRVGLDAAFRRHSLSYHLVSEITSTTVLVQAVFAGMGATVLPWSAIHEEVESGRLSAIPLAGRDMVRNLFINMPPRAQENAAIQAVVAALKGVIKKLVTVGTWQGMTIAD